MNPLSLDAYIRRYLVWLAERHYSSATIAYRQEILHYFLEWCNERSLYCPQNINRVLLERYQRYIFLYRKSDGEPLAPRTQWQRIAVVRQFFRWMSRQGHLEHNPAADLEMPRVGKRLPKTILTEQEAEKILSVPDVSTSTGLRNRAILETLYSTGIRRSELIRLQIKDIDSERGTVMIRQGKGKKDRLIPISERALAWVIAYRDKARPHGVTGDRTLFLTHKAMPFRVGQMSELIRYLIDRADIGKSGSCHIFRHTMATLMLDNGADLRYVQEMLGHSSIESTQIYTKVSISKLKEIHTRTHPGKPIVPKGYDVK